MSACHVCRGPLRITVVQGLNVAVDHCREFPEHNLGGEYLTRVLEAYACIPVERRAEHDPMPEAWRR
jgi:hypothetical protein